MFIFTHKFKEFNLSKDSHSSCLEELRCHTCKPNSFYSKFSWGNFESLKYKPERDGVDVMAELNQFYKTHYISQNMKLVVMGNEKLDNLEKMVAYSFGSIPSSSSSTSSYPSKNSGMSI